LTQVARALQHGWRHHRVALGRVGPELAQGGDQAVVRVDLRVLLAQHGFDLVYRGAELPAIVVDRDVDHLTGVHPARIETVEPLGQDTGGGLDAWPDERSGGGRGRRVGVDDRQHRDNVRSLSTEQPFIAGEASRSAVAFQFAVVDGDRVVADAPGQARLGSHAKTPVSSATGRRTRRRSWSRSFSR